MTWHQKKNGGNVPFYLKFWPGYSLLFYYFFKWLSMLLDTFRDDFFEISKQYPSLIFLQKDFTVSMWIGFSQSNFLIYQVGAHSDSWTTQRPWVDACRNGHHPSCHSSRCSNYSSAMEAKALSVISTSNPSGNVDYTFNHRHQKLLVEIYIYLVNIFLHYRSHF